MKIKFKRKKSYELVTGIDERNDGIESEEFVVEEGEEFEVDIMDRVEGDNRVTVQFGDGSCIYGVMELDYEELG